MAIEGGGSNGDARPAEAGGGRRVKVWELIPQRIVNFYRSMDGGVIWKFEGIPADARVVDVALKNGRLIFLLESNEFPEVPLGGTIDTFSCRGFLFPLKNKLQAQAPMAAPPPESPIIEFPKTWKKESPDAGKV